MMDYKRIESRYLKRPCEDLDDFHRSIEQFRKDDEFEGANITNPYKIEALRVVDELHEHAKVVGSINTIVNRDGRWIGYNTDGSGFLSATEILGIDFKKSNVLMLGSGGVARSIAWACKESGASNLIVAARNTESAKDCCKIFGSGKYEPLEGGNYKSPDIVINTLPGDLGAKFVPTFVPSGRGDGLALDVNYGSSIGDITSFRTKAWKSGWFRAFDGMLMLKEQARMSSHLWFGR